MSCSSSKAVNKAVTMARVKLNWCTEVQGIQRTEEVDEAELSNAELMEMKLFLCLEEERCPVSNPTKWD